MIKRRPGWADRIRMAREEKRITQRDLVQKFGTNQTTIVYYETGRREPKIKPLSVTVLDRSGNH